MKTHSLRITEFSVKISHENGSVQHYVSLSDGRWVDGDTGVYVPFGSIVEDVRWGKKHGAAVIVNQRATIDRDTAKAYMNRSHVNDFEKAVAEVLRLQGIAGLNREQVEYIRKL